MRTVVLLAAVAGCDRRSALPPPPPVEVSSDATGHYCGMRLIDHEGPKGQIHLAGRSEPVWFSSVRDTIVFLRSPEEPRAIVAAYVNDMSRAADARQPERGAWVEAKLAWFVIDSEARGGMGAPEAVPFSSSAAAEAFRATRGGRVVRFDDIPDSYVLGSTPPADAPAHTGH
ncbi:MAG: nitrous oxide reductase accessory protein NosL [Burkholderiales bacterium]|nr:nitrous oxide reductase accessory protein NosL [Burkholderiales bacterium]